MGSELNAWDNQIKILNNNKLSKQLHDAWAEFLAF